MAQHTSHHQHISDDTDRQNRFSSSHSGSDTPGSLRERAASQPPRGVSDFLSTHNTFQGSGGGGGGGGSGSSWLNAPQRLSSIQTIGGLPQSVPTRSASFSAGNPNPQLHFASAMRETRTFPSTFEDDETDPSAEFQDSYDDRFLSSRGRTYTHDPTRSRSQSLAATRPGAIGSGFARPSLTPNWPMDSFSNPLAIPNTRYNELQAPVTGRYGSYGVARSPQNIYNSPPSTTIAANGYRQTDISNVSPFVRDVSQIVLEDSSAFREIWAGMNHHRDEHGGGSGNTSRRHSVSVVQGRRPTIIGFNAPGSDIEEPPRNNYGQSYGGSGLLLTDDDLASDLGSMNLGGSGNDHLNGLSRGTTSQPSSLPIHAPISRAPATDRLAYQQLNLNLPSIAALRHGIGSPVDNNILHPGSSPLRAKVEREVDDHFGEGFGSSGQPQPQTRFSAGLHQPLARKSDAGLPQALARAQLNQQSVISTPSPISPTNNRNFPPSSTTPVQQRPGTAELNSGPNVNIAFTDLGKGVPLHAVPSHWHLYIVEFKAGRTDLFYSTGLTNEVRVGDLVIVEADRGKDLGKVVNDTITLREVEAFQKVQASKIGGGDEGGSPGGGSGGSKKDINPKKIFGKAKNQDIQ